MFSVLHFNNGVDGDNNTVQNISTLISREMRMSVYVHAVIIFMNYWKSVVFFFNPQNIHTIWIHFGVVNIIFYIFTGRCFIINEIYGRRAYYQLVMLLRLLKCSESNSRRKKGNKALGQSNDNWAGRVCKGDNVSQIN